MQLLQVPLILAEGVNVKQFTQSHTSRHRNRHRFNPPCHMQTVYKNQTYSDNTNLKTAENRFTPTHHFNRCMLFDKG